MKKNPFKDLETTNGILYVLYIIARVFIVLDIIGCIIGGIIMCVSISVKYGCILLFGGVFSGIIGYAFAWCANTVMRCFYDAACVTREMYAKTNPEVLQNDEGTKGEVNYVIYNKQKNIYTSDLKDKKLLFTDDEDDAMIFDDPNEAHRLMMAYDLNVKDGWEVKQIEF